MKIRYVNYVSIIFILFLFSCKSEESIEINISVRGRDSLLLVRYSNPNVTNYYIDFIPEFNDSKFKILPEGGNTFGFTFMPIEQNEDDSVNFKKLDCAIYSKYEKSDLYQNPIFLKGNSSKLYKFKINNYMPGRILKLRSPKNPYKSFLNDMKASNSTNEVNKLLLLSDYECNGYQYFIGNFTFTPNQITLP